MRVLTSRVTWWDQSESEAGTGQAPDEVSELSGPMGRERSRRVLRRVDLLVTSAH